MDDLNGIISDKRKWTNVLNTNLSYSICIHRMFVRVAFYRKSVCLSDLQSLFMRPYIVHANKDAFVSSCTSSVVECGSIGIDLKHNVKQILEHEISSHVLQKPMCT